MKVVLLCGGVGRRMAPITKDKALLEFCGKPLVCHQLYRAKRAGLDRFVIVANPVNIEDLRLATAGLKGMRIEFALQSEPSGMAGALQCAFSLLAEEPFILVSSNDIFEASAYDQLLQAYRENGRYSAYLIARRVSNYFPGGYITVNDDNEIEGVTEKPPKGAEPSNLINIVCHLHTQPRKLLDYLGRTGSTADDAYERALERMISDGHRMKAVLYSGYWQAIKYPWHILEAMDYFLERLTPRISPTAQISQRALIDGTVVIKRNARVLEGAVIRGPSYIGQNSIIGNGALVRNSIVGDDCVIGYATEIKHSYIGNRCEFHCNYIGDSVIEDDCSFGAGAITANFRLDKRNIRLKWGDGEVDTGRDKLGALVGRGCRIGVNASLMPGVRVGPNSLVGPQVYLSHDLEAGKVVLAESKHRVFSNENGLPSEGEQPERGTN